MDETRTGSKAWNIGLWILQVLLALAFGMIGTMSLVTPIADMERPGGDKGAWMLEMPCLDRFIGAFELAGGLGLVLPALTRIKPSLTPLAAAMLVLVMVLAAGFHVVVNDATKITPAVVLGLLRALLAWGRWKKAPILPL